MSFSIWRHFCEFYFLFDYTFVTLVHQTQYKNIYYTSKWITVKPLSAVIRNVSKYFSWNLVNIPKWKSGNIWEIVKQSLENCDIQKWKMISRNYTNYFEIVLRKFLNVSYPKGFENLDFISILLKLINLLV